MTHDIKLVDIQVATYAVISSSAFGADWITGEIRM